jgi:hypothetical protein
VRRQSSSVTLQAEGLEDRMVLSSASLVGSTLLVHADPGSFVRSRPGGPFVAHFRDITLQADPLHPARVQVLDNGHKLGEFAIAKVKRVDVSVAGLDSVIVNDSNGVPFAAGTTISLAGSGNFNSFTLTGSRTINGGETYIAGNGSQAGSLKLGGSTYDFSSTIGSVTDSVKIASPALDVEAFGRSVSLSGSNGVTQTLSGLSSGGAGDSLTFSHKDLVDLEMETANASATLNATAAAAGEQFFVVGLLNSNQGLHVNATPSTVATSAVASGQGDAVFLNGNSGRVFINGSSSTLAMLGTGFGQTGVTSGIKADVSVEGVGRLAVTDPGNFSTQEHVNVTESTISGTGLFGNNAVVVDYSTVGLVQFATGGLADAYTIAGSKPSVTFPSPIEIDDNSRVSLNVTVDLTSKSAVDLNVDNAELPNAAPASLFIDAPGGQFNPVIPNIPTGSEDVTFAGGLNSIVVYEGVNSVTNFTGIHNL